MSGSTKLEAPSLYSSKLPLSNHRAHLQSPPLLYVTMRKIEQMLVLVLCYSCYDLVGTGTLTTQINISFSTADIIDGDVVESW